MELEPEPVKIKLKAKYTNRRTKGKFKGGEHPDRNGSKKRHKVGKKHQNQRQRIMVMAGGTGKSVMKDVDENGDPR